MPVPASTNFAFLAAHDPRLATLGALAERFFAEDPNTCLLKLRQLGELLAQRAAANVGIYATYDEKQADLLGRLRASNTITRDLADLFHALRKAGNAANHELAGDHREALHLPAHEGVPGGGARAGRARLALMNLMLHGIESDVLLGDTLSPLGEGLAKADVIMTNPPFGTKKGGGLPTRDDFTFPTSNKQPAFLQHVYRGLRPGSRAAVVLPDNVLFEENAGAQIRGDLMEKCNLHTILRLPTGIFYAQGVKTNVLFFSRGATDKGNTKAVWFFDMRTDMPSFGKRTPLAREHFAEFETAFGESPLGLSKRKDTGEAGRFRKYTREEIKARGDNLDVTWLKDEGVGAAEELGEPEEIAAEIMGLLQTAMEEMEGLQAALGGEA